MAVTRSGSIRLFRAFDIDVYLHWSWLLVAFFQVRYRTQISEYESPVWCLGEYLALFAIVLMHEFGHALACRQVGGLVDHIVLWPLGGIAYVAPPPRPGPVLWSIAAGPLVNLVLIVPTVGLALTGWVLDWAVVHPDLLHFLVMVAGMNVVLFLLNMIPVYPLDGGQILQALLWFFIGRANSLMVVSIIGMGVGGLVLVAAVASTFSSPGAGLWWSLMAAFVLFRAVVGFQQARLLMRVLDRPRHRDVACPSCGTAPLAGPFWACDECGARFDLFDEHGRCPNCGQPFAVTRCPDCYKRHPVAQWYSRPHAPAGHEEVV